MTSIVAIKYSYWYFDATGNNSPKMFNTGSFYGTKYLEIADIDQFLAIIPETIQNATGNTSEGDDTETPDDSEP